MSIQQLKELFGNQEAILELVQLDNGVLALRNSSSENEPLVKIEFNQEVLGLLGNQTPVIAQHMVQAALFYILESHMQQLKADVMDDEPEHYS